MNNKRLFRDAIIIGLALFSTFFGAGNLIFPPTVGFFSGTAWVAGSLGLLLTAIILPVSSVWSVSNTGPDTKCMMVHVHSKAYTAFCAVGWLVCGLGNTLPRCSAMTHEIGIQNLFPGVPIWVACLGIAIALACLTTAVAVASTLSTFYSEFFHNKVTYKQSYTPVQ